MSDAAAAAPSAPNRTVRSNSRFPLSATPGSTGASIPLGGMGSIPGAVVAALILGVVESLASVYISVAYRGVFAFLVLIGVLLFRPHGLFGQKERRA